MSDFLGVLASRKSAGRTSSGNSRSTSGLDVPRIVLARCGVELMSPQQCTLSSFPNAHASCHPAATVTAFEMPETATGIGLSSELPLPRLPKVFEPQHRTVPSRCTAQVFNRAAAIADPTRLVCVVGESPVTASTLERAPQTSTPIAEPMNRKARNRTYTNIPSQRVLLARFHCSALQRRTANLRWSQHGLIAFSTNPRCLWSVPVSVVRGPCLLSDTDTEIVTGTGTGTETVDRNRH